jgi:hypothetical protein
MKEGLREHGDPISSLPDSSHSYRSFGFPSSSFQLTEYAVCALVG